MPFPGPVSADLPLNPVAIRVAGGQDGAGQAAVAVATAGANAIARAATAWYVGHHGHPESLRVIAVSAASR